MCKNICGHKLSPFFYKYQGTILLDCMVRVYIVLLETANMSFGVAASFFYFHQQLMKVPIVPNLHQHLVLSVLWTCTILIDL